jgi:hypothetical protein
VYGYIAREGGLLCKRLKWKNKINVIMAAPVVVVYWCNSSITGRKKASIVSVVGVVNSITNNRGNTVIAKHGEISYHLSELNYSLHNKSDPLLHSANKVERSLLQFVQLDSCPPAMASATPTMCDLGTFS